MMGGLNVPKSDNEGSDRNTWYNVPGCSYHGHLKETWVFNPRGFSFEEILGNNEDLIQKYKNMDEKEVLPKIWGYPEGGSFDSKIEQLLPQSFKDFQLSDIPGGKFGLTIESALDEGWACVAVQGKYCRKPDLPLEVKGARAVILCMEPSSGLENRNGKLVPRRPKICSHEETDGGDNACACYIFNVAGQNGYKVL